MNNEIDLREQSAHFAFGKNWASYAEGVSELEIAEAESGLRKLAGDAITGKRFLDIGCGSGLHSLAALRLGASEVLALDIDPVSVGTAQSLLKRFAHGGSWQVREGNVLDQDAGITEKYDIVYSWGVLHHTGAMHEALRKAASLVAPNGLFIFALYRRTRLCGFWKLEKRWYSSASEGGQRLARALYVAVCRVRMLGKFKAYVSGYVSSRGMDFNHDVHDWLGGWPYESISPADVATFMCELRMRPIRVFAQSGFPLGLRGSGCDEYVYTTT